MKVSIQVNEADHLTLRAVFESLKDSYEASFTPQASGDAIAQFDGVEVSGVVAIAKHACGQLRGCELSGNNAKAVDDWIDFALNKLQKAEFSKTPVLFEELDNHLKMRTFFVGYQVTLADIFLFSSLKGSLPWTKIVKNGEALQRHPHLLRWYSFIEGEDAIKAALAATQKGKVPLNSK